MNKKILTGVITLLLSIPGFSQKDITITVTNNSKTPKLNEPIVLNLKDYNTDIVRSATVKCEGKEIPCQLDDINQDGIMDELCFITDIEKKSSKKINITLSNEGLPKEYPSEVYVEMLLSNKKIKESNKQNLYISHLTVDRDVNPYWSLHHHGAAFENDMVAYRIYFDHRQTVDVSLRDLYNSVNEIFIASKYTSDKKEELKKDLSELDKNIIALFDYNNDACDNIISKDIYGNDLIDEDGNHVVKSIDYMTEAVPAVWERYGELTEQLNSLKADAEGYAYILGDVNRDGSVLVDDYTQILNYVLEVETVDEGSMEYLAADVNEDGNINIGDVTAVTNAILGNNNTGLRAVARYEAAQQDAAGSLELATESNGDVTRVAVRINGSAAYVGAQMDIKLPAGVTLLSATSGSSEHNLYQNTLTDGTQRVVVSSMQNSALGTNGEAVVLLELAGKVDGNISIANVFASDARGIAYSIDGTGEGTTGIGGVDADKSLKDKIYSVGGQVIKTLKKGVNILRGSDGSTKKVLRK